MKRFTKRLGFGRYGRSSAGVFPSVSIRVHPWLPISWFRPGLLGYAVLSAFLTSDTVSAESFASTNFPTMPGTLPDTGASLFRVFGALALVIAIFLAGVWLFKNWQRFAGCRGGEPKLNILEVKSLGQRQALYLVSYEQQRMLLASSPAGVTLISHLPAAMEPEAAVPQVRMSFAEAFQQVLARKQ